ncbi:MAG: efflux RND transporter permease subunit [Burkholderiales bacterium]
MSTESDRFNLSAWALTHRPLVLFAMLALAIIGTLSYQRLGQSEDPPFTFKIMLIRTMWPGATAREVEQQITDKIERKLQETPHIDRVQSRSSPGESIVFFFVKDSAPASEVSSVWYQVRKNVGDMRDSLPAGVRGPFFNDEFGETYGNIYALTGQGFTYAQMKLYADRVRAELLRVLDVAKVDFFGEQEEKIYIELSNAKLVSRA